MIAPHRERGAGKIRLEKGSQGRRRGLREGTYILPKKRRKQALVRHVKCGPGTRAPLPQAPAGNGLRNEQKTVVCARSGLWLVLKKVTAEIPERYKDHPQ